MLCLDLPFPSCNGTRPPVRPPIRVNGLLYSSQSLPDHDPEHGLPSALSIPLADYVNLFCAAF